MISPGPKTILAAEKHDSVHSSSKYVPVVGTLGRGTSFMGATDASGKRHRELKMEK